MPAAAPPEEMSATPSPCDEIRPLLSLLIDDEANPDEAGVAKAHLAVCTACASHYAFLRLTHSVLARQPAEFPSRALSERIAAATYARPTFAQRLRKYLAPAPTRYALGMATAAGLAALVVSRLPAPINTAANPGERVPASPIAPIANASPAPTGTGVGTGAPGDSHLPGSRPGGAANVASTPGRPVTPGSAAIIAPPRPAERNDARSRITSPDSLAVHTPSNKVNTPGGSHSVTGTAPSLAPVVRSASGNGGSGNIASSGRTPGMAPKLGGNGAAVAHPHSALMPKATDGGNSGLAYSAGPDRAGESHVPTPPSLGNRPGDTVAATTPIPNRAHSGEGASPVESSGRGSETVAANDTTPTRATEDATPPSLGKRLPAISTPQARRVALQGGISLPRVASAGFRYNSSFGAADNSSGGGAFVDAPAKM